MLEHLTSPFHSCSCWALFSVAGNVFRPDRYRLKDSTLYLSIFTYFDACIGICAWVLKMWLCLSLFKMLAPSLATSGFSHIGSHNAIFLHVLKFDWQWKSWNKWIPFWAFYRICMLEVKQYGLPVLEIVFENVQQKHLDKIIFDKQVMNFLRKRKQVSWPCTVPI